MALVDWDALDLEPLREELRDSLSPAEAAKLIWAFDEALRVASIDDELLDYVLAAVICLRARSEGTSPRDVLEAYFRRCVSDEEWRRRYLELLA
jgi:hypothetical protein